MTKRILLALLATLFVANVSAEPVEYPKNKDGSIITGVLTAGFDPLNLEERGEVYPFPFNLFYVDLQSDPPQQTQDGTLAVPVDDPTDFTDPLVALSSMDGFSTTEKWTVSFVDHQRNAGAIEFGSVVPGQSVRLFHVSTPQGNPLAVTGVIRELTPGVDYMAAPQGDILAIIPLKPLPELSVFLAVLTNDITDQQGNNATPDQMYYLLQRTTPWVDENGNSTYPLIDDETAQLLEQFRPLINSWEAAAESAGVPREDIILSWPVLTQSVTPVLKHVRSTVKPTSTVVGSAGMNTSAVGGMGIADIYAGIIDLPYYLGVPSAVNPLPPLTNFWTAEPGGYVPPFDQILPDTTSTHVTVYNPLPVLTDTQTVPLLMTVPNAYSGHSKPAAGWPVLIFGHGLAGNRSHALAVADTAAAAGFAVIAIDFPLHGVTPDDAALARLYVENTPFAPIANERTFDLDLIDNDTGEFLLKGDGRVDPSGTHIINLKSMLTSRDNLRQGQADLFTVAANIPYISIDGDMLPDLDGSTVLYAGFAMGSIMGVPFVAAEPTVTNAFLSVPMGGIARALEASPTFGPRIRAGLAEAGVEPGTTDYELFFIMFQTMLESGDPINWGAEAAQFNNIVVHEVINDQVVPNLVPPLSGTEPLIAVMGLKSYSSTQVDQNGVDLAGRFLPPATHGSFLDPSTSPATTVEMQKQLASFLATRGTVVAVENAATMVPIPEPGIEKAGEQEVEQVAEPEKVAPPVNKQKPKIGKGG